MRKKRSLFFFVLKPLLLILLVLSFFAVLGQKNAFTGIEYRINMLEKKKMELIKEGKYLTAEKVKLASIQNITKVAANSEGFNFPDRKKVIYVKTIKEPVPYTASYQQTAKSVSTQDSAVPYQ
jgi:hypothetical protein